MNTTLDKPVSEAKPQVAKVEEAAKPTPTQASQADSPSLPAVEIAEPSFKILGNTVKISDLQKCIETAVSDAGRLAKLAQEKGLGAEVKGIAGNKIKVVNIAAVRKLSKDGFLGAGEPTTEKAAIKSAKRVSDCVALNQFIDALTAFGLASRKVGE